DTQVRVPPVESRAAGPLQRRPDRLPSPRPLGGPESGLTDPHHVSHSSGQTSRPEPSLRRGGAHGCPDLRDRVPRYLPEEPGIPAKDFAIVADTNEELEQNMARYEPKHVDVTICVDDTLAKGVESWAWYGLQPINRLTVPNGTVLMTSIQSFGELLKDIHRKD